jgi:hypothetical protein
MCPAGAFPICSCTASVNDNSMRWKFGGLQQQAVVAVGSQYGCSCGFVWGAATLVTSVAATCVPMLPGI